MIFFVIKRRYFSGSCLIGNRIEMIKKGTNKYFVKELETGYIVIGD